MLGADGLLLRGPRAFQLLIHFQHCYRLSPYQAVSGQKKKKSPSLYFLCLNGYDVKSTLWHILVKPLSGQPVVSLSLCFYLSELGLVSLAAM